MVLNEMTSWWNDIAPKKNRVSMHEVGGYKLVLSLTKMGWFRCMCSKMKSWWNCIWWND
jgi:hypothetical protein